MKVGKTISIELDNINNVQSIAEEKDINFSQALDLCLDAVFSNMGVAGVLLHAGNGYVIKDGRYKDGIK